MKERTMHLGWRTLLLAVPAVLTVPSTLALQADDPAVTNWRRNINGNTGRSIDATVDATVTTVAADVQAVFYDATHAYIETDGMPSHNVGPFLTAGPPDPPEAQDSTYRIPLDPVVETGAKTGLFPGPNGVLLNGVVIFDQTDTRSFNDLGIWEQNAAFFELGNLDQAFGHPAGTQYHYHANPIDLTKQLGDNDGRDHSPLLGFAFDGFPIYGPYGYDNPDGTGGIVRIQSGYSARNITVRETLADGTALAVSEYGPVVADPFPIGAYLQDFEFIAGAGHLDQFNGRVGVTPEYPMGTYAYFTTLDANGDPAYPYILGREYYGVVDLENIVVPGGGGGGAPGGGGGGAPGGGGGGGMGGGPGAGNGLTVPANATAFDPFSLYTYDFQANFDGTMAFANADPMAAVVVALSLSGNGPYVSPFGTFSLSLPLRRSAQTFADVTGAGEFSFPVPSTMVGQTFYLQAVSISTLGSKLSNVNNVTFIP